jgi:hypothetical protein
VTGSGIERAAVRILDARIGIERGLFCAASIFDAIGTRQRVDILRIEIKIAGNGSQMFLLGDSGEWIFGSDLRQLKSGTEHAVEATAGEVAGMSAGGTLAEEHAHANGFRSGFFLGFDLPEAHQRRKFVAFADDALGGAGAVLHGAADYVLG